MLRDSEKTEVSAVTLAQGSNTAEKQRRVQKFERLRLGNEFG